MIQHRRISSVMRLGIVVLLFWSSLSIAAARPTDLPVAPRQQIQHGSSLFEQPTNPALRSDPLPGGCIGVTPPGSPEATCCISGFVYIDGQIVAGAEVMITTTRGDQVTMFTQVVSGSVVLPHYRLNLNTPPLNVIAGETITVTARYSSHERSLVYVVKPGGQQVDVVLNRTYADDYVYERQIWNEAAPSTFNTLYGLATDVHNNVYAVDGTQNRVQVFNADGGFVRQWGTIGNLNRQFNVPYDVAIDSTGNVYVTDMGNHRIQKFTSTGVWLASWGSFGHANGQFNQPAGIEIDQNDRVYVVDRLNHRIQQFTGNGVWLDSWGTQGSQDGELQYPTSIAIDAGFIYISDSENDRVQKYTMNGDWVLKWGTSGTGNSQFDHPHGIAVRNNRVYVLDSYNSLVKTYTTDGQSISTWGGFTQPTGIAIDGNNQIYVASQHGYMIKKLDQTGAPITSWGSKGQAPGQLDKPTGIALDNQGNLYVADDDNHRIQKMGKTGQSLAVWGGLRGSNPRQFDLPTDIAIDTNNFIYVTDSENNRVQKLATDGSFINMWDVTLPQGIAVDRHNNVYVTNGDNQLLKFTSNGMLLNTWGGTGNGPGFFIRPQGIAIDGADNIYIADSGNHRVQKLNHLGVFISQWGIEGSEIRQFRESQDIAIDANNFVYVTDRYNHRVQKFTNNGTWIGQWGKSGNAPGHFYVPKGIAIDAEQQVYTVDSLNNRIQIFRNMTFTRPIATINHVESTNLTPNDTLKAWGMGQDSDQTPAINAYRWTSNRDGLIGNTPVLTRAASSLSHGTHTITLEVQDSEGQWSTPVVTSVYVAPPAQFAWTMLLYLAGDYHDGGRLLNDFNRAISEFQQSFRNPAVRIAVQIDGRGLGDTRRLLITPGTALIPPQIQEIAMAEQAMDDPETLTNFLVWGQQTFPANHYYLAIADHGQGAQGIAWDSISDSADDGVQNDSAYLTPTELHSALSAPNIAPIDILHLDACSMNMLEVAYEVRHTTNIMIASQYLGWSYFAYADYQRAMSASATPQAVALEITRIYADQANDDRHPYTISALNMARAESTLAALDSLAHGMAAFINNNQSNHAIVYTIWRATQRFESNGDYILNELDMYIDLVDWATRVRDGIDNSIIYDQATALIDELTGSHPFVIANSNRYRSDTLPPQYAGGAYIDLNNAHGLSLFYPGITNSAVYDAYINDRIFSFTRDSHWRDFLIAGVGSLGPEPPLGPLPGPLTPLPSETDIYIPLVVR